MSQLYIIAGPNGAGKTTASFTLLPEILQCREFVNADEIARGLSPFQPEKAGLLAGRLMLEKIEQLITSKEDFAFETTLATRSYTQYVKKAIANGYNVSLVFFWLNSPDLAAKRVAIRVREGGHNIPAEVISRRYENGLKNFFNLYRSLVDDWMMVDNSNSPYRIIAEGSRQEERIINQETWIKLVEKYHGK